jgi:hypothetical protein
MTDARAPRDGVEVVVDEDGQLARWADWQAHAKGMPLVAIGRVTVTSEAGARLAVDVGSFLEGPTGLVRESGQHAFFEYFELGDTAELQPLCDALD